MDNGKSEDNEFRDIILRNLENDGTMLSLRTQLQHHIIKAIYPKSSNNNGTTSTKGAPIDNDTSNTNKIDNNLLRNTNTNKSLDKYLNTEDGVLALSLIQDLLDCLKLNFTSNLLETEIGNENSNRFKRKTRQEIIKLLDINEKELHADTNLDSSEINNKFNQLECKEIVDQSTDNIKKPILIHLLENTFHFNKKNFIGLTDEENIQRNDSVSEETIGISVNNFNNNDLSRTDSNLSNIDNRTNNNSCNPYESIVVTEMSNLNNETFIETNGQNGFL